MPFQPPANLPDFAKLKAIFVSAKQQVENYPVFQTIINFLDATGKLKSIFNTRITDNEATIVDLSAAQYATVADESNLLINSRRLLAGSGISFDDTVNNERTIAVVSGGVRDVGYWSPLIVSLAPGDSELVITDDGAPIAVWNPTP